MFQKSSYRECRIVGRRSFHSARGTASPLIILILMLIGGYYFRDIFASIVRERESRAHAEDLAVQETIQRRALAQQIEIELEPIQQELDQIRLTVQSFNAQIEGIIGLPFEVAHIRSTRRLDRAILKSDAFAETWTQLLRARVTPEMIDERRYVLTEINHRIMGDKASELDRQHLDELHQWMQQVQQRLEQHQSTIVRLANYFRQLST